MRAEHMQPWLEVETCEERPDMINWYRVIEIFQMVFRDGRLPAECKWQTAVLIPKGNGGLWGTELVKVL